MGHMDAITREGSEAKTVEQIPTGMMDLGIGPVTVEDFGATVAGAKTVIWNGPLVGRRRKSLTIQFHSWSRVRCGWFSVWAGDRSEAEGLNAGVLASGSFSGRTELSNSHEIVSCGNQVSMHLPSCTPAIASLAQPADRFHPAKGLRHLLSNPLTEHIARMADGARVERRTSGVRMIMRDVWSNPERAAGGDKVTRVVTNIIVSVIVASLLWWTSQVLACPVGDDQGQDNNQQGQDNQEAATNNLAQLLTACSLPGDGEGHGPQLSYTDNGNGTVKDNVTGLLWQKTTNDNDHDYDDYDYKFSFLEASTTFLSAINGLGGHYGWRLPNVKELQSIVNYGVRVPAINQNIFGPIVPVALTARDDYWSNTLYVVPGGGAWKVDFNNGGVSSSNENTYVRAVWGSPVSCFPGDGAGHGKPLSYTDNGNGTVTDNVTGLMWEKTTGVIGTKTSYSSVTDVNNTYTWVDANTTFLAALNGAGYIGLAGYNDWRLPNIKELESIVNYGVTLPAINQKIFGPTIQSFYWSSTPHTGANTCAWGASFGTGNIFHNDRTTYHYVRAVRGGVN